MVAQSAALVGQPRLPRQFRTENPLALRDDLERLVDALQKLGSAGPRLFPTRLITGDTSLQFGQLAMCAEDLVATITLEKATDADIGRLYGLRLRGTSSVILKDAGGTTLATLTIAATYLRVWEGAA